MNTGWYWALLIVELGLLEGLLALFHHLTLSQWIWRQNKRHWWSRWVVLGLVTLLALHLVLGWLGGPSPDPAPGDTDPHTDCIPY